MLNKAPETRAATPRDTDRNSKKSLAFTSPPIPTPRLLTLGCSEVQALKVALLPEMPISEEGGWGAVEVTIPGSSDTAALSLLTAQPLVCEWLRQHSLLRARED